MTTAELVKEMPLTALQVINREEIDVAISTAKQYPRDLVHGRNNLLALVTMDADTAASMYYALPRGGKVIEGPTVRFAECLAHTWGNLNVGARQTEELDKYVVAQGVAHDLEANVRIGFEVKRRIVDSHGARYNSDMIGTTGNAAAAIALRNAVLRVIPKPYWQPLYLAARAAAIGKKVETKTLAGHSEIATSVLSPDELVNQREMAVQFLQNTWKIPLEQILKLLKRDSQTEINEDNIAILRGLATALKDGDITVDEAVRGTKPIVAIPTRKPAAQKRVDKRRQKPAKRSERPSTPKGPTVITEAQGIELYRIADRRVREQSIRGAEMASKLIRAVCAKYRIQRAAELPAGKFNEFAAELLKIAPPKK